MEPGIVVVVDDDQSLLEAISIFLEDHGFRTIPAYNGASALTWLQYNNADLAIIDVHLPDISGIEVAVRLRLMGDRTPVILTSSDDGEEMKEQCHAAGVRLFLSKPFAPEMLLEAIYETLPRVG